MARVQDGFYSPSEYCPPVPVPPRLRVLKLPVRFLLSCNGGLPDRFDKTSPKCQVEIECRAGIKRTVAESFIELPGGDELHFATRV